MKKYLILALLPAFLFLAACDPEQQQQYITEYKVVLAPDSMYNCPKVERWPEIKTLKDVEVARIIVDLVEKRNICAASLNEIKKFYINAKQTVEAQNTKTIKRRK